MKSTSWVICVDPKSSDKLPYETHGKDLMDRVKRPCEDENRDWRTPPVAQEYPQPPEAAGRSKSNLLKSHKRRYGFPTP